MRRNENPLSWRYIAAGILVGLAVWVGTRGLYHAERAMFGVNYGYMPDPAGTARFLSELDKPKFQDAGKDVLDKAKGIDTFLFRYADKAHRAVYGSPLQPWNQGSVGSCVSFGWGMGSYVGQSVDWATGKMPDPPLLVAVEPIYAGARTAGRLPPITFAGWSDGAYGGAAARWVSGLKNGTGGILYRQKYGTFDLSHYDTQLCREWGAYGVPAELAKKANEHTAKAVALCETWEGLCAAIESGYCVPICSNVGFAASNVRDQHGYLRRGGNWNHCMVCLAVRYSAGPGGKDGVLVMNSWGPGWVTGPKWPSDQPDGSFWITRSDAEAILAQGDSFVIGGVEGFRYRDLHHGQWLHPPAPEKSPAGTARLVSGIFQLAQ